MLEQTLITKDMKVERADRPNNQAGEKARLSSSDQMIDEVHSSVRDKQDVAGAAKTEPGSTDKQADESAAVKNGVLEIPSIWDDSDSGKNGVRAGEKLTFSIVESDGKEPAKKKEPPKTVDKELADGVVKITAQFPGQDRIGQLSAFPVDVDGGTDDVIDGKRKFATAYHGVGENRDGKKAFMGSPYVFKTIDANKDGELSLKELQEKKNYWSSNIAGREPEHYIKNFDEVSKLSRDLDPNATGITHDGIKEYIAQNTKLTIFSKQGKIPAKLIDGDKRGDVAVIEAQGLTPSQEKSFGKNFPLSDTPAEIGDDVNALGFKRGTFTESSGEMKGFGKSNILDFKEQKKIVSSALSDSGMSGGPLISPDSNEVVGINHGTGLGGNKHATVDKLKAVLQRIKENEDLSIRRRP